MLVALILTQVVCYIRIPLTTPTMESELPFLAVQAGTGNNNALTPPLISVGHNLGFITGSAWTEHNHIRTAQKIFYQEKVNFDSIVRTRDEFMLDQVAFGLTLFLVFRSGYLA